MPTDDRWARIKAGIHEVTVGLDAIVCGDDGDDDDTKETASRLYAEANRLRHRLTNAFQSKEDR